MVKVLTGTQRMSEKVSETKTEWPWRDDAGDAIKPWVILPEGFFMLGLKAKQRLSLWERRVEDLDGGPHVFSVLVAPLRLSEFCELVHSKAALWRISHVVCVLLESGNKVKGEPLCMVAVEQVASALFL